MKIKNKSQGENENNSKTNSKLSPFKKGLVVSVMSAGILFGSMGMLAGCGEQGPQGEQGIQGEQGAQGPQGEAGTDGATWLTGTAITGTETSITATVDGAKIGDLYLNITTCDIYQCTAENTWKWIANIKGEQGQQGEQGQTGNSGQNGSQWLVGTEAPNNNNGNNGDFYLNKTTYDLYQKTDGAWELIGNIKGEQGQQGASADISISEDGYWVINGEKTEVKAQGADGSTPTIAINEDGFWVINGIITDVNAKGEGVYGDTLICNPLEISDFADKKITILGDSVTVGVGSTGNNTGYAKLLGDILGATIENKGSNGTLFCEGAKLNTGANATSRLNDLRNYNDTTDYFIVALGANDWTLSNYESNNIALGTLGSTDTTTIYGAVNVYCQVLVEKFKDTDTKIYFSTPTISGTVNGFSSTAQNRLGYTLRDICNAIIETAAMYDIPTFDMNLHSGIYYNSSADNNTSSTMKDGVHPSDAGHELMANALANFLLENYSYESEENVRTLTLQIENSTVIKKFLVDSSYVLPTPTAENKTFLRWVDSNGKIYKANETITLSTNTKLTAVFSSEEQVVEYKVNVVNLYGGIADNTNNKTVSYDQAGLITQDSLNLEDSLGLVPSFYKDADLSQEFNFETDTITSGTNTIYVNWETTTDWFTIENNEIKEYSETFKSLASTDLNKITRFVLPSKSSSGEPLTVVNGGGGSMSLFFNQKTMTNLKMFVIPEGYKSISDTFAFAYQVANNVLTFNSQATIYIPASMTAIGDTTFININANKFVIAEGNTSFSTDEAGSILFNYNKTRLIKMLSGSEITNYTVPENVTAISPRAFACCYGLTSLEINSNLSLDQNILMTCPNLTTLTYMGDISNLNRTLFTSITSTKITAIYVKDETEKTDLINLLKYNTLTPEEAAEELTDTAAGYANYVQVKPSA